MTIELVSEERVEHDFVRQHLELDGSKLTLDWKLPSIYKAAAVSKSPNKIEEMPFEVVDMACSNAEMHTRVRNAIDQIGAIEQSDPSLSLFLEEMFDESYLHETGYDDHCDYFEVNRLPCDPVIFGHMLTVELAGFEYEIALKFEYKDSHSLTTHLTYESSDLINSPEPSEKAYPRVRVALEQLVEYYFGEDARSSLEDDIQNAAERNFDESVCSFKYGLALYLRENELYDVNAEEDLYDYGDDFFVFDTEVGVLEKIRNSDDHVSAIRAMKSLTGEVMVVAHNANNADVYKSIEDCHRFPNAKLFEQWMEGINNEAKRDNVDPVELASQWLYEE